MIYNVLRAYVSVRTEQNKTVMVCRQYCRVPTTGVCVCVGGGGHDLCKLLMMMLIKCNPIVTHTQSHTNSIMNCFSIPPHRSGTYLNPSHPLLALKLFAVLQPVDGGVGVPSRCTAELHRVGSRDG